MTKKKTLSESYCWKCGETNGKFVKVEADRFGQRQTLVICRGCYDESTNSTAPTRIIKILEEFELP